MSLTHVECDAQDGKNIYADADWCFTGLPEPLRGADWVMAGNSDALFSALDLMQIEVAAGIVVSVAHDDRLPRPSWLTRQFQATDLRLAVNGLPMTVFQHRVTHEESLTLGSNTDDPSVKTALMYIVLLKSAH
jgi:beta-galactosidase